MDLECYTEFDAEVIPAELASYAQWVAWRPVPRERADGTTKIDKIPIDIGTGGNASSTDATTWSTFDEAVAYAIFNDLGVGFVLMADDPFVGVDLDDCVVDGQLDERAADIVGQLASYTEVSPSGTGVRVIVQASGFVPKRKSRDGVEMYASGRFLTMTGRHLVESPDDVVEAVAGVEAVHKKYLMSQPATASTMSPASSAPIDYELAREAMTHFASWRAGDYGEWARIGHALKHSFSEAGFDLWNEWSMSSPKYDPADARNRWSKLSPAGDLDVATIFAIAKEDDPAYRQPSPASLLQWSNGDGPVQVDEADIIDRMLAIESFDDYGNSNCLHALHGDAFVHTANFGWMNWTGSHWDKEAAEAAVTLATRSTLVDRRVAIAKADTEGELKTGGVRPTSTNIRGALFQFKALVTTAGNDFDAVPHLLNCKNGVVDLRSGDLVAHDPSDRFTYCVPTDYAPGADAGLWERTLLDIFADDFEKVAYLKRALGYSVTGDVREECMFYLYGAGGRNGKGTIVNAAMDVLQYPLGQATQFSTFSNKRDDPQGFLLAPLHNARMVAASESRKQDRLNEGVVKMVTGRDSFQVAFKGKTPFVMTPAFKIWLMSNHPIRGDVDDDAFWYRFRLIEFPKTFKGVENKALKSALATPASRRGILAWLVHGAMQWYQHGLGEPQSIWDAVQRQRDEFDDAKRFIEVGLVADVDGRCQLEDAYQAYKSWAGDVGISRPWSMAWFSRKMQEKHIAVERLAGPVGKKQRYIVGYTIGDEYDQRNRLLSS